MAARIVVVMRGGIVQGVAGDVADTEVAIYDHDSVGDDPECRPDQAWAVACAEDKELPEDFDWIY